MFQTFITKSIDLLVKKQYFKNPTVEEQGFIDELVRDLSETEDRVKALMSETR